MLHVLTGRELGNSLAVVVRYFGGVKLGAGGLVRAYSAAVSTAVAQAQLVQVSPSVALQVIVDFAREAKIRHLVNLHQGQIVDVIYSSDVTLEINLPAAQAEEFTQQVANETAGEAVIRP